MGSVKPPKLKQMRHCDRLTWPQNARNSISKDLHFTLPHPPPYKDLKPLSLKSCICPRVRYSFGSPIDSCSCNAWQKCLVFERKKERRVKFATNIPLSLHGMESHKRLLFAEIIFSFVMRGWVLLLTEGAFLFFSSSLLLKIMLKWLW